MGGQQAEIEKGGHFWFGRPRWQAGARPVRLQPARPAAHPIPASQVSWCLRIIPVPVLVHAGLDGYNLTVQQTPSATYMQITRSSLSHHGHAERNQEKEEWKNQTTQGAKRKPRQQTAPLAKSRFPFINPGRHVPGLRRPARRPSPVAARLHVASHDPRLVQESSSPNASSDSRLPRGHGHGHAHTRRRGPRAGHSAGRGVGLRLPGRHGAAPRGVGVVPADVRARGRRRGGGEEAAPGRVAAPARAAGARAAAAALEAARRRGGVQAAGRDAGMELEAGLRRRRRRLGCRHARRRRVPRHVRRRGRRAGPRALMLLLLLRLPDMI
ncbi:hypothetical protein BS78_03G223100 [Paspalum vaginatum]|nr:hypothetical protein BS78_03G223100 [Paspalum vaginatum]